MNYKSIWSSIGKSSSCNSLALFQEKSMTVEWDQRFSVLRPSAAKVFAIAWQKRITALLQERGSDILSVELVQEAFKATLAESSSLPVRDKQYRLVTLHCAMDLLAVYHPYGSILDRTLKSRGWTDSTYGRYYSLLRRHGLEFSFAT